MPKRPLTRAFAISLSALVVATSAGPAMAQDLPRYLADFGYSSLSMEKLSTGHEVVAAEINGVPGRFVVDSGASSTVIHAPYAEKSQLGEKEPTPDASAHGAGGNVEITRHRIQSIKLSNLPVQLSSVVKMDLSSVVTALKRATGADIDGVIGQDILTNNKAIIDISNQRIFLQLQAQP